VAVRNLHTGAESTEAYDALVLSPGAEPVRPPIPGADDERVHTLRSMADMDGIKAALDQRKPDRAVVIGGGYVGLEMAEALRSRDVAVTLVELADQVFIAADPEMVAPIHQQLGLHGVDLRLGTSAAAVDGSNGRLAIALSTGESVECDLAILAVGVRPEVTLAREAGLEIGSTGGIAVDGHMRTSDPAIYAVGDAVQVNHFVGGHEALIPLAGPANRQGRIAADNLFGRPSVYRNSQGTAICKVFDLAIGMTGMSEKELRRLGRPHEKVYVHPASHAGYYPGASPISLKLLFDPDGGRVLGAQAVGAAGIDKRIDVLAVAVRAGMTVHELKDLELSYAPPFGSAKDPVNYAGFVAANVLDGDVGLCHVEHVTDPAGHQMLLDVRTPEEAGAGTIPGAVNIPVDELRSRLDEVPADKELLVFCQVGLRGYVACRILNQRGYRCRNLTGGYKTYKAAVGTARAADSMKREMTEDTGEKDPAPAAPAAEPDIVRELDCRGLQCPGPIMRLRAEMETLSEGQAVTVVAGDPGFAADVAGWCDSTGNELREIAPDGGGVRATIVKGRAAPAAAPARGEGAKTKSIVLFSGDFDKAVAAFIIANGAAAMGSEVTIFFTFWGLNVLRRDRKVKVRKSLIERMLGWMMPRGPSRLSLSKMNMAGMGTRMIKGIMRKKNVSSLPELIDSARRAGVKLVACTMTMDLMGIRREELIDGVAEGGVATYLNTAEAGNVNLFI
jgi:NADPH-dependent 2,4-dienoyl-CoA reductase/sulfur reductase-like enzyme/peroxiredoxin family protein/rhodanese-related sulfurtransferase/TusA-related sulfurtransferase